MGFIQLQPVRNSNKSKGFTYVTFAQSYRPEGSKTPRQKRVYLGKLQEDGQSVLISKKYGADSNKVVMLEDLKREAKDEAHLLRWIKEACGGGQEHSAGRKVAGRRTEVVTISKDTDPSSSPAMPEVIKSAGFRTTRVETLGQHHLLSQISEQIGLSKALGSCMDENEAKVLLALAMFQVCEGEPLYLAQQWLHDIPEHALVNGFDYSSGGISRFMTMIGESEHIRESFFREWIRVLGRPSSLIFDTTSLSSYAKDLSLVEYGYNRDKESLPQVNMTMVSDKSGELPLYYRTLPGSIPDVSLLKNTVKMLSDYGIEQYACVLDRGFYSAGNLRQMMDERIHFAVGAPFSNKQATALVKKHRAALGTTKSSILSGGYVYRYQSDFWMLPDGKNEKRTLYAHIFLNPSKRADMIADIEKHVLRFEEIARLEISEGRIKNLQEAREWIEEHTGMMKKCFVATETKNGLVIRRLPRAVALMTSHKGYTIIVTDQKEASGSLLLEDYRSRDQIEKLFDMYKNENGQKRMRSGKDEVVSGRFFLAFISLILRKAVEVRMRKSELSKSRSVCDMLKELRKVKVVYTQNGTRVLLEITKKQREIYEKLDVSLPL